jgi:hypothetical protein
VSFFAMFRYTSFSSPEFLILTCTDSLLNGSCF